MHYFTDPGNMIDLSIVSDSQRESVFDVVDESRMHFVAKIGKVRRRGGVDPGLSGKHVFVGATALATSDFHSSPLGAIPVSNTTRRCLPTCCGMIFFRTAPLLLRIVLYVHRCDLCRSDWGSAFTGAWLSGAVAGTLDSASDGVFSFDSGLHIFRWLRRWPHWAFSYGICVLLGFRSESRARARAESAKEFVRQTFGRYLTDEVAQQILDSPDGLRRGTAAVCRVMMTDLRGFLQPCTELSPEQVVKLINHYLEVMTKSSRATTAQLMNLSEMRSW